MKDMAQLRLQAEVSQLEGTLESTAEAPSLPPYLVPDATALTENLQQIKQLTNSARFIVIIALAGRCRFILEKNVIVMLYAARFHADHLQYQKMRTAVTRKEWKSHN